MVKTIGLRDEDFLRLREIAKKEGCHTIPEFLRKIMHDYSAGGQQVSEPATVSLDPHQESSNPSAPIPIEDDHGKSEIALEALKKKEGEQHDEDRKDPEVFGIESYR